MRARIATRGGIAVIALGFAFLALALATRLPFRDTTMFISDSVRYALALERYDMTAGRPHPPGNPLYIGMVDAADRVFHDPPTSLAWVSALMSGFAFLFAYQLGRDLAGEAAGWVAAAILVTSPLFWFFGGLGMPATGEAALSLLFARFARTARDPRDRGSFWVMTFALAMSFGFRSTFAVLVAPLWVYAAWRHPVRRVATGAAAVAIAAFGWTWLVATLSGGWEAYRSVSGAFFVDVVLATKILGGGAAKIPAQILAMGASAVMGLGLFLVPCLAGVWRTMLGRWPFPGAGPFLAAWALPAVIFHSAYDWAPRFGVLLLAPASILAATTTVQFARSFSERRPGLSPDLLPIGPLARAGILVALAANLSLFLLPARIGGIDLPDAYPSGSRLLARNFDLARRDAAIRAAFDREDTVVLAYDHAFHCAWFLPEFRTLGLFPVFKQAADNWIPSARRRVFSFEPGSDAIPVAEPIRLPDAVRRIVIYDRDYLPYWPGRELPPAPFDYGGETPVQTASVPGPGCLEFGYHKLAYVPAGEGRCPERTESR